MTRRTGTAVGDFLAGKILHLANRCIALHIPKSIHAGDLRGSDLDRRFLHEGADYGQCSRTETDLGVPRNDSLHVLTAASREYRVDVDIIFFVEASLLGNVNRQCDGKQDTVGNHNNNFRPRRSGPRRGARAENGDRHNQTEHSAALPIGNMRLHAILLASLLCLFKAFNRLLSERAPDLSD